MARVHQLLFVNDSAQLESRDPEDAIMDQVRDRTEIHSGAAEYLAHSMVLHQFQGSRVVLRRIQEEGTGFGEPGKTREKGRGRLRVICEERTDLASFAATSNHPIAAEASVAQASKGKRIGLADPTLKESGGRTQSRPWHNSLAC